MGGGFPKRRDRRLIERPGRSGGRSHDERMIVESLTFRHQGAGADQTPAPDPRAIEHDRAHADQRPFADRAAVQDRVMADRALFADRERRSYVGVQRAGFLNVGARADVDRFIVAAQDCAEPNSDVEPKHDIADHAGVRRDPEKAFRRRRGATTIERIERHATYSSPSRSTSRIAICSVKLEAAGSSAEMTPRKSGPLFSSTESVFLSRPAIVNLSFSNRRRR